MHLETLEDRAVPAGIHLVDGNLMLAAADSGSKIMIHPISNLAGQPQDTSTVVVAGTLDANLPSKVMIFKGVEQITFVGGEGRDFYQNNTLLPEKVYGNGGNDILRSGFGLVKIHGGEGSDLIDFRSVGQNILAPFNRNEIYTGQGERDTVNLVPNHSNVNVHAKRFDRLIGVELGDNVIYDQDKDSVPTPKDPVVIQPIRSPLNEFYGL